MDSQAPENTSTQELFKPHRKIPYMAILGVSITAIVAVGIVIGLMWQSNSFIAQNQDVRSDASTPPAPATDLLPPQDLGDVNDRDLASPETTTNETNASTASPANSFSPGFEFLSAVDQRFGINGGCLYARTLGIPWTYNWGWMNNADRANMQPDNVNEIRCIENNRGAALQVNTLITLAKNDGIATNTTATASAAWSRTDVDAWIAKAQAEGKWDTQDQADFALLDQHILTFPTCDIQNTIENKCSATNGKRLNLARIKVNYVQIPFIVARYPGAHYQIANEPEFGFSYFPETYAKVYRIFYDRIKKYDPNAKVAIGSIGLVEFDHPFNQIEPTFKRNTAYQWMIDELGRKGIDTPKNRDIAWLALVYSAYSLQNNGKSLTVDFVAIHPYPWPPDLSEQYKKYVNGNFYSYQWPAAKVGAAVADTIAQIDKFKSATAGTPFRYNKKPLWITEIDVLVNKNATPAERDAEAQTLQKPFMQQLYQQLLSSKKVQKIFWHTGLNEDYQPTTHIESGFVFQVPSRTSGFNVLGEELSAQKIRYPDSKPPTISALSVTNSGNNPSNRKGIVDVVTSDTANTGQGASGIYRLWYTSFLSQQTPPTLPSNLSQWRSVLTTASTTTIELKPPPSFSERYYVAVQAEDAYGNVSAPTIKQSP